MADALPQTLAPFHGTLAAELSHGAAEGLGPYGERVSELVQAGLVPACVLTGMTLHLLASQPRRPREDGREAKKAIAGGVWVREQVTIHRPVALGQELVIRGESARRFSRRGRRYGVTSSETRDTDGRRLVSSCTTGLLRYRKEPGLPDGAEGRSEDAVAVPGPDLPAAAGNPAGDALTALGEGQRFEGERCLVSLEMMRARDAGRDDNPIHTEPSVAAAEGLAAPIAGGSHVLSFLHETLMRAWGTEALLHGAHFDVRWTGQTYAGTLVTPRARVERLTPQLAELSLEIEGEERAAMVDTLLIPRP